MERVFKNKRKITISEALGLDPNDPDDQNFLLFNDILTGLRKAMIDKEISMNELARRMQISRQAVYEKFSGKNTSMEWIQRACTALGVNIHVTFTEKKKAA